MKYILKSYVRFHENAPAMAMYLKNGVTAAAWTTKLSEAYLFNDRHSVNRLKGKEQLFGGTQLRGGTIVEMSEKELFEARLKGK